MLKITQLVTMPGTLREDIALTLKCPTGRASEQRGPGETHPLSGVTVQMGHLEPRGGALPRHTARVSLRESSHADAQPSRDSPKGRVSLQREKVIVTVNCRLSLSIDCL